MQVEFILLAFYSIMSYNNSNCEIKGVYMKEILSKSGKLYLRCIVGSIMCFFLVITFNVIGTGLFTKTIGYTAYGTKEGDTAQTELYTHYYSDGEDTQKEKYIDEGYTLNEVSIRSQIAKKTGIMWDAFSQICLLFMMGVFVYNDMWTVGFKDSNMVRIKAKIEDKLKGLKIGAIVTVPSLVLLTVLVVGKMTFAKDISVALYAFFNAHLYEAIILLTNGGGRFSELAVWQILVFYALLSIIPIIAHIAYTLGYKSILVSEKLIYKNKQEK